MFPAPRADVGDFKIVCRLFQPSQFFDLIKRHHLDLLGIRSHRAQPVEPCAVCTSEVSQLAHFKGLGHINAPGVQ
jgi:hypothetical protein